PAVLPSVPGGAISSGGYSSLPLNLAIKYERHFSADENRMAFYMHNKKQEMHDTDSRRKSTVFRY
ncbi:MAG: hypothetical protein P8X39_12075, partial [Desulfofustis sp.]